MDWIEKNVVKVLAIAIVVVAIVGLVALNQCSSAQVAHTKAKLSAGQTGAAIESGGDAVDTLGNRQAEDARGTITVEETEHAIDNATDAGGVTDAGISGLCNLRGYSGRSECLRHPAP